MINRQFAPGPRRSALLGLLAAWLLTASGCAQMGFPEWPQTAQDRPAADTAEDDAADADPAAAEASEPDPEPEPGKLYDWTGDGREVTRIVIDTNTQLANFYAGGERVGWTTIATGVSTHPTPRGQFSILEKVRDKRSNLYGKLVRNGKVIRSSAHGRDPVPQGARFVGASMPHFMRLTYDGIGMHAGPIPNPGQPASHGCIRMPPKMAKAVFAHVGPNTAVTVVGNGPDYGNYAERIARQRAEERARRQAEARARRAEEAAAAARTPREASAAEVVTTQAADAASPGAGAGAADAREAPADTAPTAEGPQPEQEADVPVTADTGSDRAGGDQAAAEARGATAASDGERGSSAGAADTETSPRRSGAANSGTGSGSGSGAADSGETSAEAGPEATPTRQSGGGQPQQRAGPDAAPPPAAEPADTEPAQPAAPPTPPAPPPTIRAAGDEPVPAPQI